MATGLGQIGTEPHMTGAVRRAETTTPKTRDLDLSGRNTQTHNQGHLGHNQPLLFKGVKGTTVKRRLCNSSRQKRLQRHDN
jgi:hypothetical protein